MASLTAPGRRVSYFTSRSSCPGDSTGRSGASASKRSSEALPEDILRSNVTRTFPSGKVSGLRMYSTMDQRMAIGTRFEPAAVHQDISFPLGEEAGSLAYAVIFVDFALQGDMIPAQIIAADPPFAAGRCPVLILPAEPVVVSVKIETSHAVSPVCTGMRIRLHQRTQTDLELSQFCERANILLFIPTGVLRKSLRKMKQML